MLFKNERYLKAFQMYALKNLNKESTPSQPKPEEPKEQAQKPKVVAKKSQGNLSATYLTPTKAQLSREKALKSSRQKS